MPRKPTMTRAAMEARRRNALDLVHAGHHPRDVAKALRVTIAAIHLWRRLERTHGPDGLKASSRGGGKPRISDAQLKALPRLLLQGPRRFGFPGDDWHLEWISTLLLQETGRTVSSSRLSVRLRRNGVHWRKPFLFKHRADFPDVPRPEPAPDPRRSNIPQARQST